MPITHSEHMHRVIFPLGGAIAVSWNPKKTGSLCAVTSSHIAKCSIFLVDTDTLEPEFSKYQLWLIGVADVGVEKHPSTCGRGLRLTEMLEGLFQEWRRSVDWWSDDIFPHFLSFGSASNPHTHTHRNSTLCPSLSKKPSLRGEVQPSAATFFSR